MIKGFLAQTPQARGGFAQFIDGLVVMTVGGDYLTSGAAPIGLYDKNCIFAALFTTTMI